MMMGIGVLLFVLCIRTLFLVLPLPYFCLEIPTLLVQCTKIVDHEVLIGELAEKVGFTHISISSSLMPMVRPPRSSFPSYEQSLQALDQDCPPRNKCHSRRLSNS